MKRKCAPLVHVDVMGYMEGNACTHLIPSFKTLLQRGSWPHPLQALHVVSVGSPRLTSRCDELVDE